MVDETQVDPSAIFKTDVISSWSRWNEIDFVNRKKTQTETSAFRKNGIPFAVWIFRLI